MNCSIIFGGLSSRVKETKAKVKKWDLIKLKSFCTAKEILNKTKTQPTEWEKLFENDMTDKGLISNIYKQLIQLNIKKHQKAQTTQLKKWAEELNRHFSQEEI